MLILLTILHKQFPELFHLENWNHVPSEQFHISFLPQPLATTILFSVYINLNILQIHNIFMISLSVMSSRYIHITACIWVFFLFRLNNCMVCVHVCIYITFCLSTPVQMNPPGLLPYLVHFEWYCMHMSVQIHFWDFAFNSFRDIAKS